MRRSALKNTRKSSGTATQIHGEASRQTGIPTRPGVMAGNPKRKGVLSERTPALHWVNCGILGHFWKDSLKFTDSVYQIEPFPPLRIGGF
jgi:hypothetical protein